METPSIFNNLVGLGIKERESERIYFKAQE